jgi:hypothetical protein
MKKIIISLCLGTLLGSFAFAAEIPAIVATTVGTINMDGFKYMILGEGKGIAIVLGCGKKSSSFHGPILNVRAHLNQSVLQQEHVSLFRKEYTSAEECDAAKSAIDMALLAQRPVNFELKFNGPNEAGEFELK